MCQQSSECRGHRLCVHSDKFWLLKLINAFIENKWLTRGEILVLNVPTLLQLGFVPLNIKFLWMYFVITILQNCNFTVHPHLVLPSKSVFILKTIHVAKILITNFGLLNKITQTKSFKVDKYFEAVGVFMYFFRTFNGSYFI